MEGEDVEGVGGLNSDNKQSSTQLWNLGNKAARAVSSEDGRGGGTGLQRRKQEDRRKKREMENPIFERMLRSLNGQLYELKQRSSHSLSITVI